MRRIRSMRFVVVALAAAGLLGFSGCPKNAPKTVAFVDIERYLGLWYQIAAYEQFFNRGLVAVTAKYSLNEDGTIRVFNRGLQGSLDGPENTIVGKATVVDTETNAKLEVQFDFPLGALFKGQYWIVDLDEQDYSYAVVSDSFRGSLFILSRTPQMDQAVYDGILERLAANGFDTSKLIVTEQPTP